MKDGETNEEEMGELFAPSRLLRCSHVLLVAPQTQSAHHKADIFFQQSCVGEEKSTFPSWYPWQMKALSVLGGCHILGAPADP